MASVEGLAVVFITVVFTPWLWYRKAMSKTDYDEEVKADHDYRHDDPPPLEEAKRWIQFFVANLSLVNGFWGKLKAFRQLIRVLVTR